MEEDPSGAGSRSLRKSPVVAAQRRALRVIAHCLERLVAARDAADQSLTRSSIADAGIQRRLKVTVLKLN